MSKFTQDKIVNYLKNYGFVFPCSEIYNGLANAWDYGPVGVLLKNNLKALWWSYFVTGQRNMVGLDSSILLNPDVWKASGHLSSFTDPLIDCKACKQRFRVDKLILSLYPDLKINEKTSFNDLLKIIKDKHITCPSCKKFAWTEIRNFNLMFQTYQGVVNDKKSALYLRPETAQGIFINFVNIQRSLHLKVPFGVGQIGKAFRNEITPGNFIFRTREFEQMEIEFFCYPKDSEKSFEVWLEKIKGFLYKHLMFSKTNIKLHEHAKADLSHYSSRTIDIEYNFPHGWSELWGLANRTDFDLLSHEKYSKKTLAYLDPKTNKRFIPYVIEPSVGVERLLYALICEKYAIEKVGNDEREVLHLPYALCPYKVAVLPLSNKLEKQANKIFEQILKANLSCAFDTTGSIGKRYRRQDAIGTMYCLTYDFDSDKDHCVTIRNRDSMKQERIKISEIIAYLNKANK